MVCIICLGYMSTTCELVLSEMIGLEWWKSAVSCFGNSQKNGAPTATNETSLPSALRHSRQCFPMGLVTDPASQARTGPHARSCDCSCGYGGAEVLQAPHRTHLFGLKLAGKSKPAGSGGACDVVWLPLRPDTDAIRVEDAVNQQKAQPPKNKNAPDNNPIK